jgi:carboxymethylenebutenolidase
MQQQIELTAADGHRLSAYAAGTTGPALVVVQEAFGVNHHIRNVCERFAEAGFRTVAPALFDRLERGVDMDYSAASVARYRKLRPQISVPAVLMDLAAAADHLGAPKTGIVGYCFGGTVSWWAATRGTRFAAASCWYGGEIAASKDATPHCPVQMHFGALDAHITPGDVDAIRAAQPAVEVFVYAHADHGFGCDERASYHEPSYRLAQQRTVDFLRANLG